ncbi:MAG: hypothetical protein EXS18_06745 [Verrucomicrobiae bacterium]|nr:hypothetical protein [Verrucomicrobiae bacterium]
MIQILKNAKLLHRCVDYLTHQIESRMPLVPVEVADEKSSMLEADDILPRPEKSPARSPREESPSDRSPQNSFNISVCGEEEVPDFHGCGITDILTCISPERPVMRPNWPSLRNHLIVRCDDVEEPLQDYVCPNEEHVRQIIQFGHDTLNRNRRGDTVNILVHCAAGISRSTAATLLILSMKMGKGTEAAAMRHLTSIRPICRPNAEIVRHGDRLLQREGRIIQQVTMWKMRHYPAAAVYG